MSDDRIAWQPMRDERDITRTRVEDIGDIYQDILQKRLRYFVGGYVERIDGDKLDGNERRFLNLNHPDDLRWLAPSEINFFWAEYFPDWLAHGAVWPNKSTATVPHRFHWDSDEEFRRWFAHEHPKFMSALELLGDVRLDLQSGGLTDA